MAMMAVAATEAMEMAASVGVSEEEGSVELAVALDHMVAVACTAAAMALEAADSAVAGHMAMVVAAAMARAKAAAAATADCTAVATVASMAGKTVA